MAAGSGLPIPKNDNVRTEPLPIVSGSIGSTAAAWQSIAASGEKLQTEGASYLHKEVHQAQIAQIASFETDWRAKKVEARDRFANDPEGFKTWAQGSTDGAIAGTDDHPGVPAWMVPHAKQFLSREFEGTYNTILGERRAQDKHLDAQAIVARTKMADDDVMSIAANGKLNTPEGQAAVQTYKGVLGAAVNSGLMAGDHAQFLTEDLTTRAQGTVIRNSVEQVYREKGYDAAREHLDKSLEQFGTQYKVTDAIRTKTLGWLRSEESGLRGERDAISKEWAAAKGQISTLDPTVLQDIQNRAYSVGAFKVGDDIQAHTAALTMAKTIRQLPFADQVRVLATGSLDAKLVQSESGGDPSKVNQLGYVGTYQFGAPRLKDLGVYTPGAGENMAAWSRTPATAPGKWSGTFNIPGFPDVKTMADFRASPEAQKAAYSLHQQRTEKEIDDLGLGQYEGQTVRGVPITRDGLRAMIHLGGAEGTRIMLASGGAINRADDNGTTLLDYARLGASNATPGSLTGSRPGLLALGMVKKDMTQDLSKKITDLQSHIAKTEFPPMEEIGALGAQVHLLGNEEQKRQVAEMAAQAEYGKKFVALPAAQRTELVGRWMEKMKNGATDYERRLADTVKTADGKVTELYKKDPYQAASLYMEGIPALPAVDWSSPTLPQQLAAKVVIQNTIRADQNLPVFSALGSGEATALGAQLVNGDPKQSKAILGAMAANLPDDIYKATISDGPIKAAFDGMMRSYDPNKLDLAMSTLDNMQKRDPIGFSKAFEGSLPRLQTWQAHKDSLTPTEMADYFKRADDPSAAASRAHLEKEAEKLLEHTTPLTQLSGLTSQVVANQLGSTADRWVPFVNQAPPVDSLTAGVLVNDYNRLFKERYIQTNANEAKAREQTVERLKTTWGPSVANDGALMKYPPEKYFPKVDDSHDWIKKEIEGSIMTYKQGPLGVGTVDPGTIPGRDPVLFGKPFTYKLISDARTEADVSSKRPPSYTVVVRDGATGRDDVPIDSNGKPLRFSFDSSNAEYMAREKFTTTTRPAALAVGTLAMPVP